MAEVSETESSPAPVVSPSGHAIVSLWGSHACRSLRMDPPSQCVEGETGLLTEMRTLLGPFASEKRLLTHLRAVRGKVNWAVNRYLREELMSGSCPDFHPKPPAGPSQLCGQLAGQDGCCPGEEGANPGAAEAQRAGREGGEGCLEGSLGGANREPATHSAPSSNHKVDWLRLPDGVMLAALCQLGHQDLCQVAASCKWLRELAYVDPLWKALYEQRWGRVALEAAVLELERERGGLPCSSGSEPNEPPESALNPGKTPLSSPSPVESESQECAEAGGALSELEDGHGGALKPEDGMEEEERRPSNGGLPCGMREAAREGGWRRLFHHRLSCERATKCPQCVVSMEQNCDMSQLDGIRCRPVHAMPAGKP